MHGMTPRSTLRAQERSGGLCRCLGLGLMSSLVALGFCWVKVVIVTDLLWAPVIEQRTGLRPGILFQIFPDHFRNLGLEGVKNHQSPQIWAYLVLLTIYFAGSLRRKRSSSMEDAFEFSSPRSARNPTLRCFCWLCRLKGGVWKRHFQRHQLLMARCRITNCLVG